MVTPTGLHYWEKVSIGADLEPEDNVQECLQILKDETAKFQQKSIEEEEKNNKPKWKSRQIDEPKLSMIEQMDACTELSKDPDKGILSFELTFKTPEEKLFYDAKVIELTNKNK